MIDFESVCYKSNFILITTKCNDFFLVAVSSHTTTFHFFFYINNKQYPCNHLSIFQTYNNNHSKILMPLKHVILKRFSSYLLHGPAVARHVYTYHFTTCSCTKKYNNSPTIIGTYKEFVLF